MGKFDFLVERLQRQTPEEFRQSLIRAGIHDEDMELADHYCSKKQLKEKRNRRKYKAGTRMYAIKVNDTFVRVDGSWLKSVDAPEKGTLYTRLSDARYRQKQLKGRYGCYVDGKCVEDAQVQIFEVEFNHTAKWVDG